MAEARADIAPAGWQITATTLSCDRVADYVTVLVYRDWSYRCTWCDRYKLVAEADPKRRFARDIRAKISRCRWPGCDYVLNYRDKLIAEEAAVNK
ncbi:MAG: hypothetical protein NTV42_01640 [Chloroflexi bacterium]|nr:hypothetical protein [Chloroflexota bacterium]